MILDAAAIAGLTCRIRFDRYVRVTPWAHRRQPLGMGFGRTRFASPADAFRLLYVGQTLDSGLAEAIVRDRFEGATPRQLTLNELAGWGACEVRTTSALVLLDLRGRGCFELGISTDIAGGKSQSEASAFSQALYDGTALDGLIYKSRLLKDQDCVAIYDQAVAIKLAATPVERLESLADLVPALDRLKIVLA